MLIAARSSQDFACCLRATMSARSKYALALASSRSGDVSAISPAARFISASHHLSLVVSIVVIASLMQRQASLSWPSSALAFAKYDRCKGIQLVDPVDRYAMIPKVSIWIALAALPVSAKTQPRTNIPFAFQYRAPFLSANETTSSNCALAAPQLPHQIWANDVLCSAYINVAMWLISRASLSACSASASAAPE